MAVRTKPDSASGKRRDIGSMVSTGFTVVVAIALVWMAINAIRKRTTSEPVAPEPAAKLVDAATRTMTLTPEMVRSFGLRTKQAQPSESRPKLVLVGSLFIDQTRMVRVHSRFDGEVISIGKSTPGKSDSPDDKEPHPLRRGDFVRKGELLAIVWSKDIGEKKSDLVGALSQMYLDRNQLTRVQKLTGIVPDKQIREAEHQLESDRTNVDRIERTLRSWRLTEDEIEEVRKEAETLHENQSSHDPTADKTWAEVDVKAPFDAVVMERNATTHDLIQDDLDLFVLADLTTLGVSADAYEEDLPALESIPPEQRKWMIQVQADSRAAFPGTFETIGEIIDPRQHTAPIIGWVDNKNASLLPGQSVTATIELPSTDIEVAIPRTALVDEGVRAIVFVASDESGTKVSQRQVAVARPDHDLIYIRCQPTHRERDLGCQELKPNEWVVSSGTVELASTLEDLIINAAAQDASAK
jgi:membrane fusion protein, heavy metal efflux system